MVLTLARRVYDFLLLLIFFAAFITMHGFVQMQWLVDLIDVCCARIEVRKYKCIT